MGCLPQSASFKVIELDFLTYFLIDVKPWSFVRESEVSMQLDVASCNPSWFACDIFICRKSTACVFISQCHWGSSSVPSLYHVRLMKASPKLPFIVVIVIFSILLSSRCFCLFFMESLLYTQQNIYQNIDLLKCL